MRQNVAAAAFLLLCVFMFGFGMNACGGEASRDRFGYAKRDFDAKICGNIDGDEVAAVLKSRPSAKEGECDLILSFSSPAALGGMTLTRYTSGECEARLGELVLRDFKADGLFEPFLVMLYSKDATSVKRNDGKSTTVRVSDGSCELEYLFLDGYDYPHSIKGSIGERKIELTVQSLDFIE